MTQVPLTVEADDKSKTYGGPADVFTATYTGLVNGEQPSALAGVLAFDLTDTNTTGAGSYTVTHSWQSSNNYATADASVTQRVNFSACVLYDQTKAHEGGSLIPFKLQPCDAHDAVMLEGAEHEGLAGGASPVLPTAMASKHRLVAFDGSGKRLGVSLAFGRKVGPRATGLSRFKDLTSLPKLNNLQPGSFHFASSSPSPSEISIVFSG